MVLSESVTLINEGDCKITCKIKIYIREKQSMLAFQFDVNVFCISERMSNMVGFFFTNLNRISQSTDLRDFIKEYSKFTAHKMSCDFDDFQRRLSRVSAYAIDLKAVENKTDIIPATQEPVDLIGELTDKCQICNVANADIVYGECRCFSVCSECTEKDRVDRCRKCGSEFDEEIHVVESLGTFNEDLNKLFIDERSARNKISASALIFRRRTRTFIYEVDKSNKEVFFSSKPLTEEQKIQKLMTDDFFRLKKQLEE